VQAWDYRYTDEGDALVQDDLTTPDQGEAYAYDGMHRLADNERGQVVGNTVPFPSFSQGWTLDKVGNWTVWNNNGGNETRTHNNHHALTSRSTVPFVQAYDANFNQTDDGSAFTFVYDANDQLQQVKARTTGVVLASYRYDAFGRRVEKLFPTAPPAVRVMRYYYSDQRIIEERNGSDLVRATYTHGTYIDEPLTMDRGGQRFYYHSNKQFSTYALTNSAGQIVERYSYTPYGQVTTFDAAYQNAGFASRVGNPFSFTGRELDVETGLMHFRARTYDPVQGRFKQRDPIEYLGGMNLYQYVGGRPTFWVDPVGLVEFKITGSFLDHDTASADDLMAGWVDTVQAECDKEKLTVTPNDSHTFYQHVKGVADNSKNPPTVIKIGVSCATIVFRRSFFWDASAPGAGELVTLVVGGAAIGGGAAALPTAGFGAPAGALVGGGTGFVSWAFLWLANESDMSAGANVKISICCVCCDKSKKLWGPELRSPIGFFDVQTSGDAYLTGKFSGQQCQSKQFVARETTFNTRDSS
jgi:RHS repeat-associated protein